MFKNLYIQQDPKRMTEKQKLIIRYAASREIGIPADDINIKYASSGPDSKKCEDCELKDSCELYPGKESSDD